MNEYLNTVNQINDTYNDLDYLELNIEDIDTNIYNN